MGQDKKGKRPVLLLATHNRHKVEEMTAILTETFKAKLSETHEEQRFVSLLDFPNFEPPPETGSTYRENAEKKACAAAKATGHIALGDDSGLEIDALNGAPGIHSARWMGNYSQREKNERILELLKNHDVDHRRACFRCSLAVCHPGEGQNQIVQTFEGALEGFITGPASGSGGFGYDPIFLPGDVWQINGQSLAELEPEVKNAISHRAKALKQAAIYLDSTLNKPQICLE